MDAKQSESSPQLEQREDEDEDRDLDEEEIRVLQEKLRKQRKSWPCSVSIGRRKVLVGKKSCSLDEEQTPSEEPGVADDLWRLEFPPPSAAPPIQTTTAPIFSTIPERPAEDNSLPESEEEEEAEDTLPDRLEPDRSGNNDWELRMLVQEFERNARRRRHSSGEALTWDRALRLRSGRHHRRKYSLVETAPLVRGSSPGMSRWLSLDGSEGSLRTSSACSQETVVAAFPSAEEVPRSPSSPNFVADRDCATALECRRHLPEWPSSPCLPTIREDGRSSGRSSSLSALHDPCGRRPSADPLPAVVIAIPDCETLLSP